MMRWQTAFFATLLTLGRVGLKTRKAFSALSSTGSLKLRRRTIKNPRRSLLQKSRYRSSTPNCFNAGPGSWPENSPLASSFGRGTIAQGKVLCLERYSEHTTCRTSSMSICPSTRCRTSLPRTSGKAGNIVFSQDPQLPPHLVLSSRRTITVPIVHLGAFEVADVHLGITKPKIKTGIMPYSAASINKVLELMWNRGLPFGAQELPVQEPEGARIQRIPWDGYTLALPIGTRVRGILRY